MGDTFTKRRNLYLYHHANMNSLYIILCKLYIFVDKFGKLTAVKVLELQKSICSL